jgi:DNA-binding transcriptional MocR family regulator
MPGEPFFINPEQNLGYLRLNFSHVAPERLAEGLSRLADVIRGPAVVEAA